MSILTTSHVSKFFAADEIFRDVNVELPQHARVALVGPNGAGKTTLLRILIGEEDPSVNPDTGVPGSVHLARGTTIGFLPQRPELYGQVTVWDEMLTAFEDLRRREAELHDLTAQMGNQGGAEADALLDRYGRLQHEFELAGGYEYESRIKHVLMGLGFSPNEFERPIGILSGGQKTRAFLARLLLQNPDLLVLDEPTNHLDINAVEWLESFLASYPGAVLVVSHDRYFMDNVVNGIWELDWGRVETYRGNYSHYVRQREERHEQRWAEYETQQEYIAKQEDYIRRNMAGQNTRQAKGRLKRLDRLKRDELITRPRQSRKLILNLQASIRSGDKVLMTQGLEVGYPDGKVLFRVPDLTLYRGEVAAVIGPNGVGKSTMIKTLLEQIPPRAGESKLGAQVKIGYFAQAHELLNDENSILDELLTVKDMPISAMRDYLAKFLFIADEVFRPISTLSGGERGRVALAKLALGGANFLLLDEPTNHLDIPAQEVLQAVLTEFEGTILLVSHDRYLINALATQIWAAEPGSLEVFEGTYREYLTARESERQQRVAQREGQKAAEKIAASASSNGAKTKSGVSARERERRVAAVEQAIHDLEQRLAQISSDLETASAAGDVDKVRTLGSAYTETQTALEEKMGEWETLAE
ncbi:MAG: ABC-F family ATP-binding cassette domain-containing protein [Anaerolineae bacterium]|nr:ABC-F family ATP-binding cassette domain-containing protein [Anaerolineae bacterium]